MGEDPVPWEIWTLNIDVISLNNESGTVLVCVFLAFLHHNSFTERLKLRETLGDSVADIILNICGCMNKQQYVPKMPVHSELGLVFDTRFNDVQPYLYKVTRRSTHLSNHRSNINANFRLAIERQGRAIHQWGRWLKK